MERMNDWFPHENFIELFFPFLKSQPRGFLVSLFPPYRDYIGIDLELVLCPCQSVPPIDTERTSRIG